MTPEEKQLLLKDLCSRLPYGIVLNVPTIDGSENKKLVSIVNEDDGVPCVTVYSTEEKKSDGSLISYAKTIYAICDVLPYLRPMSSMTVKEKTKIASMAWNFNKLTKAIEVCFACLPVVDYCYSRHLDIHGLIEKSLAIVAPEGMYKTE